MYTVIYSTDPYLLARLATDLQMEGIFSTQWNDWFNPFSHLKEDNPTHQCKWMAIGERGLNLFEFYSHNCSCDEENIMTRHTLTARHTLTSRNYLKVLGAILNSKK